VKPHLRPGFYALAMAACSAVLALSLCPATTAARSPYANSRIECVRLYIKYGLVARADVNDRSFSTRFWSMRYRVEPLRRDELPKVCDAIESFYLKYPALVHGNLVSINVVGGISYGERFAIGGTYYNGMLYLASRSVNHTEGLLERVLHHEFSSILMKNHPLPTKRDWLAATSAPYRHDSANYFRRESRRARHEVPSLLRQGFINVYATTNFENDFNSCAEYMWTMPDRFKALGSKYPRIETKRRLMASYYDRLMARARSQP